MNISCVLLAAGNAERFGSNKLLALYKDKPLVTYVLDAIPKEKFHKIVLVTQYQEIKVLGEERGFEVIINSHPEWGIAHSIALGTTACEKSDGIMYCVSDQPDIPKEIYSQMVDCYREKQDSILSLTHNGIMGNPSIFPQSLFSELKELTGDRGGKQIMKRYPERCVPFEVQINLQNDIDYRKDLK